MYSFCVHIVDPDGTIKVTHTFWGRTVEEAERYKRHHLNACEYFQAAEEEGRTIEEEIEAVPDADVPRPEDFEDDEGDEDDEQE